MFETRQISYIIATKADYVAPFKNLKLTDIEGEKHNFVLSEYELSLDGMRVSVEEMNLWLIDASNTEVNVEVKVEGDELNIKSAAGKSFVKKARGTEALAEAKTILEGLTPVTVLAADGVTPVEWAEGKIANADIKVEVDPNNDPLITAGTRGFTLSIDGSGATPVTVSVEFVVE